MQIPPQPAKLENPANPDEYLSYPQYIAVAKKQINYANDIKSMILEATTNVVEQRPSPSVAQQVQQQQQQQAQQQQQQQPMQHQQQQPMQQQLGGMGGPNQSQMQYQMGQQQPMTSQPQQM